MGVRPPKKLATMVLYLAVESIKLSDKVSLVTFKQLVSELPLAKAQTKDWHIS